mmetsp:Transcript_14454/g.31352  ORF Transcript_14454/g.31352 Transcript_14454/m.31352 type:complete len:148 (-) Transcript_14454:762-1205(-)
MAFPLQSLGGEDESLRARPLCESVRVGGSEKLSPLDGNMTIFPMGILSTAKSAEALSTAKSADARSASAKLEASSASRNSCSSLRATVSSLVVSMNVLVKLKLFRGELLGDPRGDVLGQFRGDDRGEDLGELLGEFLGVLRALFWGR